MNDINDPTLKLVATAYAVAIQPDRFDELLNTWDEWSDAAVECAEVAFAQLSPAFLEALSTAERFEANAGQRSALEFLPTPTVVLDAAGAILAMNTAATRLLQDEGLDPQAFFQTTQARELGFARHGQNLYRLKGGPQQRSYLAMEAPVGPSIRQEFDTAHRMLLLSLMDWNDGFERDLAQRLNLSAAELRVARGMLEGRTAQEISGDQGRSLATIRSHIKALLNKTGTRRQTELVQFLTILRQVADVAQHMTDAPAAIPDAGVATLESDKGALRYVQYGAGQPLLYLTTSSRPEEEKSVRDAFAAAGFRVFAPTRPGFRGSSEVDMDASDALLDHWLDQMVAACGPRPVLVGHREGGIVAARAAARLLRQGGEVAGLALISTGAPVTNIHSFNAAPPSIRRSFLAAHFAKPALRLGYGTAARLFRSGAAGQEKIVKFFYRDSQADAVKAADPEFFRITRDNIDFCFDSPMQVVRDIELWGSDWSDTLDFVAQKVPVLFVHGTRHTVHPIENIQQILQTSNRIHLHALDGSAQLALYEHPEQIARVIADLR